MVNTVSSRSYTLGLKDIDKSKFRLVGGKGANLGELASIDGMQVPGGFCISTEVFKRIMRDSAVLNGLVDQLTLLKVDDHVKIRELSRTIRNVIEATPIPKDIQTEINDQLIKSGDKKFYAVRSSATAEDLPSASFAGQQDTYLNITGSESILKHISKCLASLFTERAVIYRIQHGFDHRKAHLSVVIQEMIFSKVSGIMFTADPVNSNRKIVSIDASFGLGEALVSGIVNADNYKVRNGVITEKTISNKDLAIYPINGGGTIKQEISSELRGVQALSDKEILELENIGRKIEQHFGNPQDIEWCMVDGTFYIVQSRPITTLFPIPPIHDQENHVFLSVGHAQMMTDAMRPLGLTSWLLMTPAFMCIAGGRLFVDVTHMLAPPETRQGVIDTLGKFDPLVKDALMSLISRGDFIKSIPKPKTDDTVKGGKAEAMPGYSALHEYDPNIVSELITNNQNAVALLKQNIQFKSGAELFDFIIEDMKQLKQMNGDPRSMGVIFTGINAASWINEKMNEWLGETNAADTLTQSAPNNITSEMGLALLDVADVVRQYPQVIAYLEDPDNDDILAGLVGLEGGKETLDTLNGFLNRYGMRCAGEIDVTNPRWIEKPGILVPTILSNVKNFGPGAAKRKFEQGLQEAIKKEVEILDRLKQLPDGEQKAEETKRMINLVRNYAGYREYPKYGIVCRYLVYKQALLKEGQSLVEAGLIDHKEDIYFLTFEELRMVVASGTINQPGHDIIKTRREEYELHKKLSPPRVITSDGEIITGKYNREDLPVGAIPGLAVSSGVIEGRARVILKMEDAQIEDGDILVTPFTDPSWTPLFVSINGLVTEVGGLMTHGAVIAREYGLPAVVGVEGATKLIKDGQRIRLNGTNGYVEIL